MAEINKINIKGVDYDIGSGGSAENILEIDVFQQGLSTEDALIAAGISTGISYVLVGEDPAATFSSNAGIVLNNITEEKKLKIANGEYSNIIIMSDGLPKLYLKPMTNIMQTTVYGSEVCLYNNELLRALIMVSLEENVCVFACTKHAFN